MKEGPQEIATGHWIPGVYALRLADGTTLRLLKK